MALKTSKILVTGGTGFIGSRLARRLATTNGWGTIDVTGFEPVPDGCQLVTRDFRTLSDRDLDQYSHVWHLAAETDTRKPDAEQWDVNAKAAIEFLTRCKASGIKHIVYASSCAVYGAAPLPFREEQEPEPLNAYGAAKAALDKAVGDFAVGIRPTNVYGTGEEHKGRSMSIVAQIVRKVRSPLPGPIELFDSSRDFVTVDDVVSIMISARFFPPGVYNAGSDETANVVAVAAWVIGATGSDKKVREIPCPFAAEFQRHTLASMKKTKSALSKYGRVSFTPTRWIDGVRHYMARGWPTPDLSVEPGGEPRAPSHPHEG